MTLAPPAGCAQRTWHRLRRLLPLLLVLAVLPSCAGQRSAPSPTRYHPAAYHPEDFPDIPLFPLAGYELDPNVDQLAISLGGGSVRRFEVAMINRPESREDLPEAVLGRYDIELAGFGWIKEGPGRWRKGRERLVIEAGRSRGLTTVQFHLRPVDAEASSRP